ncbi:putative porin [Rhodothermus marinus]|uniref:putative porin n=1 Tax=Rhodothermus marinus TaxID=29549 RepID=UPI0037C628C2
MSKGVLWIGLALLALPAAAQAPADTTGGRPPVGFGRTLRGEAVSDTLPARLPLLHVTDLLGRQPGTFTYAFRLLGWPEGWSPDGLPPHLIGLRLDGRPFEDPVTGRPAYELLPLFFLMPIHTGAAVDGAPEAIYAELRPYGAPRPLTELRYRTGGDGLQSIMALHVQNRRLALGGRPGLLQLLFGYGGHAMQGAYPGSRLRRGRQVLVRLRYQQRDWALELMNLHNRAQVGAHGGVLPHPGGAFETIYEPFGATVRYPYARRQTIRNDLSLTLRTRTGLSAAPLTASVYWTAQTFRYRNPELDTLTAKTNRYGFLLEQPLGGVTWRLEGRWDRLRQLDAWPATSIAGQGRTQLRLLAADTLRWRTWRLALQGQVFRRGGRSGLDGALTLTRTGGRLRPVLHLSLHHPEVPRVFRAGWGGLLQPCAGCRGGRIVRVRLGVQHEAEPFTWRLEGFAARLEAVPDLYAVGAGDTVQVQVLSRPLVQGGLTFGLGWRRTVRRGLYAEGHVTTFRTHNSGASTGHRRQAGALPAWMVQVRLGARMLLFQELDTDVYLLGRYWTSFRSRQLHAPTGLLALPEPDARRFGPSGTLDLYVEAGLRTAKLFLVWENLTSGTALQPGVLLVPVYPLPARRLRFGVYWPIWD